MNRKIQSVDLLIAAVLLGFGALPVQGTDVPDSGTLGPAVASLAVEALTASILVGDTAQLFVHATFEDGTSQEVTSDPGTFYNISPHGAVVVDGTGMVQALEPSDVDIYIQYGDFIRGFVFTEIAVKVRADGDRDGDGLPDAWEIKHRLNPDFPGDALADGDGDALDNFEEFAAGTDPRLADTDGDLETDGIEVEEGTDPLVSDQSAEIELPALDESCMVSVLNRTAPVNSEGVWVLPNVPATFGRVRLRASCVEDGTVRSGQSDFFTVPPDGVIQVTEVVFDQPEPVPASLSLTAPVSKLTTVGQTVQLTASALLPDGSSTDVTTAAAGTTYLISNSAVAAIDEDGLVTAVSSGAVLVSAVNEGTLGILRLEVLLSGDSDGDGLPDDFEIANALNPNDPSDALSDPDEDGLTVLDEFQTGLDPFDPDTDDDQLVDGQEIAAGTNPLLFDTDGDFVSDGLEVFAQSDPLDPSSVNLVPILESMTVSPEAFTLVFNTVLGEGSRRLQVTGTLIDGTSLDITGPPYGTIYASSDLTVASFGLEPGRIFAGQDGIATITAANGSFTADTVATVESFSPTALSFIRIPGFANGVAVDGTHAYVAAGRRGLFVIDVQDPSAPFIAGSWSGPGNFNDVRVRDGFVYVANGDSSVSLQVVDVRDPASPQLAGEVNVPGEGTDLAIADGRAYLAAGPAGLQIIDVTDPFAPARIGSVDTPGNARGIDVVDGLVVIADDHAGVHVVDVSDPTAPFIAGSTHTRPNAMSQAADVVVRGRLAYVADGSNARLGGLRIVDFRVPSTPVVLGSSGDGFGLVGVALAGDLALTADYLFANAVPIFNVATATPAFSTGLDFSRAPASGPTAVTASRSATTWSFSSAPAGRSSTTAGKATAACTSAGFRGSRTTRASRRKSPSPRPPTAPRRASAPW